MRVAMAIQRSPSMAPKPTDLCLLLFRNKTEGALQVQARMSTPRGQSFLDEAVYDLEPGGCCAFLSCAGNDLMLLLPSGAQRLTLRGSELRLTPGLGMKQRLTFSSPALGVHRWQLAVDVETLEASFDHVLPSLTELLEQQLSTFKGGQELFRGADFPPACSVFLPKVSLSVEVPWKRLVVPEALFFADRRTAEVETLDGGRLRVEALARSPLLLCTFEPPEDEPLQHLLQLRADPSALRCAERWQLTYLCD